MQRYFVYLAYDGTAYHGWQVQPNGDSVQQRLTDALSTCMRNEVQITGAGRTDTGVHARMMVAHFDASQPVDTNLLTHKLNCLLPRDIAIYRIVPVKAEAHARFDAVSRTYQYFVGLRKDPFERTRQWTMSFAPDFERMNKAAHLLLECSDFTSFCKLHSDNKTNICHLMEAHWDKIDDYRWVFTIRADRFLRNMVRAVVGTLVDVGRGKLSIDDLEKIISAKNRSQAGSSAPAEGLFLCDIVYPQDLFLNDNI